MLIKLKNYYVQKIASKQQQSQTDQNEMKRMTAEMQNVNRSLAEANQLHCQDLDKMR